MSAGPYGALLDAVRGVRWPAARRVMGATLGAHASNLKGNSSEFSEFRPYRQGDDPHRIDWRLLARSDRAYVRITTDRATFRTSMLVDASASMAFPLPNMDKWRLAREVAVGLAAVAHAEADPVGLAIAGEKQTTLVPRARRSVLLEMMRALDATTPRGTTALAPMIDNARASRLVVITDVLGDADDMISAARLRVAARGEVILVHIVATEELNPPTEAMLAVDPEAPTMRRVLDDDMRREYVLAYTRWLDDTAAAVRAAGVRYIRAETNEPAPHLVRRIAGETARRGG
ncbi:MAG: hypothetical protein JWM95_2142 [Gemmatimonadetes bacterium]|nr:hypothetical protein [Gemmatimonadota bacterium]